MIFKSVVLNEQTAQPKTNVTYGIAPAKEDSLILTQVSISLQLGAIEPIGSKSSLLRLHIYAVPRRVRRSAAPKQRRSFATSVTVALYE